VLKSKVFLSLKPLEKLVVLIILQFKGEIIEDFKISHFTGINSYTVNRIMMNMKFIQYKYNRVNGVVSYKIIDVEL
jgi:preprotein translocase subunit SecF